MPRWVEVEEKAASWRESSSISVLVQPTLHEHSQARVAVDHLFVSNVRFLSMAAVVLLHCIGWAAGLAGMSPTDGFVRSLLQPFKFGTIGFFLISGFLMEESLTRRRSWEFLKRRLQRVAAPWAIWFLLCTILLLASDALHGRFRMHSLGDCFSSVFAGLDNALFGTAYWFVPNLLIALCVLLLCRRFRCDLRLGGVLLLLSLFYGLNVYAQWIPMKGHTEALLGFVFYLWLGGWGARNIKEIERWIGRVPMISLVAAAAVAGLVALRESDFLAEVVGSDSMNTLRISNQIYSVIIVLAIFKLSKAIWPSLVNVRTTTFGIYLIHTVVLLLLGGIVNHAILPPAVRAAWSLGPGIMVCLSLVVFAVTYGCSLGLTELLLKQSRLRWMVGSFS